MDNLMPSAEAWADVLQRHFPTATVAAETYTETNAGQQSRRLARRLAHERVRYEQFVSELLLVSQSTSVRGDELHQNVGVVLGADVTRRCLEKAHAMGKHLCQLTDELSSTSRETVSFQSLTCHSLARR
jgi:hypothetical protein